MSQADYQLRAWDRIEGVPDPLENRTLVGHADTLDLLAQHYASGRMHHAWLLSGPRGIGKATLAARFAGHVFRHPSPADAPPTYPTPALDDPVEGRVGRGAHPNLLLMRRPWNDDGKRWRSELTVDEIRRTVSFFGTSSGERGWRVAIVDTADDLNPNAANALLKVLEEPPPRTLFLVLAHSSRGQMATIRSRCVKISMRPLTDDQVLEAIGHLGFGNDSEPADRRLAAQLSGGSVRRAILLLSGNGVDLYRRFIRLVANAGRPDWGAAHELAGELAPAAAQDRFRLFIDIAHDYFSRRIRGEAEPLPQGEAVRQEGISELARWVEVWEKTRRSVELADEWNLDRKQVVLNLFTALREAA